MPPFALYTVKSAGSLLHRIIALAGLLAASAAPAQSPPPSVAPTPLTDYVGTYADGPNHKIEILIGPRGELVAVIDDAVYPLQAAGPDELRNGGGGRLPFQRGPDGKVSAFVDHGERHRKLSADVSADTRALLTTPARPAGEVYRYAPPADRHDGIAVGDIAATPLGVGVANAIVAGVVSGAYPGVHSVLLYQDGRLVLEEYFYGYDADRQQQLRSATKSVVGALAGIAIDHGVLRADTPALGRLHLATYANPDPRKPRITVRDFLTMQSGLACDDHSNDSPGRETVLDDRRDWIQAMYDLPQVNDPGTKGFYCSGGVAVVGRVVENSTRVALPEYADRHLFKPLGIRRADWSWRYDLTNNDKEFAQIHMRPRDMLKLGILYADRGVWRGKRVISGAWVDASSAAQSTVDNTGYGYFWWRPWLNVDGAHVYLSAAQGNGGQKIYVLPQYRLVAVFTGGLYNSASPMNEIMASEILPRLLAAYPGVETTPGR